METNLLLVIFSLLATQFKQLHGLSSHLAHYDQAASSSSFGEPVFRLEPPNVINLANNQGATIVCLASGSPRPTISWYSSSLGIDLSQQAASLSSSSSSSLFASLGDLSMLQTDRPVGNVSNLRQIVQNGAAIRLLPFKEADFRQDIHSTEYRCVASNQIATIHSRSVLVRPVMSSDESTEVKVNDEFVGLGSVAVFKCRATGTSSTGSIGAAGPEFSHLLEWFTSDGIQIGASETSKGNKFVAFKSGELHVVSVDMGDLQRTYGCRLRNSITNRILSSSGLAQLIVTDSIDPLAVIASFQSEAAEQKPSGTARFQQQQQQPIRPQVVHSTSQLIAMDSLQELQQFHRVHRQQQHHHQQQQLQLQPEPFNMQQQYFDSMASADATQELEWRLLLPCAVRAPSGAPYELRWFYQPPRRAQKPISLSQWAALNSIGLINNLANSTQQHPASNYSTRRPGRPSAMHSGGQHESLKLPNSRFVVNPTHLAIEWPTRILSGRYTCQLVASGAPANSGEGRTVCDTNVIIRQPMRLRVEANLSAASAAAKGDFSASLASSLAAPSAMFVGGGGETEEPNERQAESPSWIRRAADWIGWPSATGQQQSRASNNRYSRHANTGRQQQYSEAERRRIRRRRRRSLAVGRRDALVGNDWPPTTGAGGAGGEGGGLAAAAVTEGGAANPLLEEDLRRIKLRGPANIEAPPVVRVGQRLQLDCLGIGHPIESVKWFRNGQPINTQSSSDFQVEITSGVPLVEPNYSEQQQQQQQRQSQVDVGQTSEGQLTSEQVETQQQPQLQFQQQRQQQFAQAALLSALIIRQVQPRDVGLQMFECFGSNSLGDRVRAGKAVFVAEQRVLEWARSVCPLRTGANQSVIRSASGGPSWQDSDPLADYGDFGADSEASEDYAGQQLDMAAAEQAGASEWLSAGQDGGRKANALFRRHNPVQRALLLEAEPVELICPSQPTATATATAAAAATGATSRRNPKAGSSVRVDWRRWTAPTGQPNEADGSRAQRQLQQQQQQTASGKQMAKSQARNFNQLFSGDSNFVINGSSLQIRSPSKRHDEALYVCGQTPLADGSLGTAAQFRAGGQSSFAAEQSQQLQSAALAGEQRAPVGLLAAHSSAELHQSSLASSASSCSALLASALFQGSQPAQFQQQQQQQQLQPQLQQSPMSSISIRIVAKPKIDPFEFSRNLEEGMRAVAVCAVISGQSPVDITWFKDGQLLLADEQTSIDQANGFSSTLTFHRIRPAHSGFYTCVAANAFAAANHTSRLLVNEAPYFIEAPKNTRAILNKNVLVNCRAGGQPNPQIRWRKMVPIGGGSQMAIGKLVAPSGGGLSKQLDMLFGTGGQNEAPFDLQQGSQVALEGSQSAQTNGLHANKFEFKIITSNSHIQILENGSMIIKEVELSDASRYVCQAFNGINPSLSEVIDLVVLSPAQFDVNYETVSVKRDSVIKFNCAPKGDQPMRIEWHKEGNLLVASSSLSGHEDSAKLQQQQQSKYSEIAYFASLANVTAQSADEQLQKRQRHSSLILQQQQQQEGGNQSSSASVGVVSEGLKSSELFINYADRSDTGIFVCVARNAYGMDKLTYRLIVQEPPDVPQSVNAQNVQASSLKLTWTSPFDGNLPLTHFVIEYRKATPTTAQQLLQQLPNLSRSDQQQQQREWLRLVVSTSKLVSDQVAPLQQQQLLLQAPLLGFGGVGSSSTQGLIQGQQQLQQMAAPSTNVALVYSIVLRQLSAKSTYQIRVAAVNAMGQGGFSSQLIVTTAEEPPSSRPNDLRAQPLSSSSIKVLWRGPAIVDEQAPIAGYYISHRKLAAAPAPPSSPQQEQQQTQTNNNKEDSLVTNNAQSNWLATSSISAVNISEDQVVGNALGRQFGSGNSMASPVPVAQLPISTQSVAAQRGGSSSGANYEYQLNMLDKNTKYEIRVQPFNSMGVGPSSDTIGQTLKFDRPSQPNLKLVAARRQSFELKWTISDSQPLMGFSLFYKCEYDDWQEIQLGIIYHYVIENLRCGNKYQIYLSAFNVVGRSDPSDVLSVRTEGTVPIAPDKGLFIRSNMTEIVLDMSGWQSGGCPINSFMIQFKRIHDTNWFILSEGAAPFANSDKVTVPDLVPATWYKLLVTALNEAGSTNAEYLFSTLTLEGEQIVPNFPIEQEQEIGQAGWFTGLGKTNGSGNGNGGRSMLSSLSQLLFATSSNSNNSDGQLLLPISCILVLLTTSLFSYIYYSRSSGANASSNGSTSDLTPQPINESGKHYHQQLQQQQQQQQQHRHNGLTLGRSPSLLMNRIQLGCDSMGNSATLGRLPSGGGSHLMSTDEKQLIQSNHHLHHLMQTNTLPLDAGDTPTRQQGAASHTSMFDSLLESAGLQSFVGVSSAQNSATLRSQRAHGMKLLSPGNIFSGGGSSSLTSGTPASNCTNSSSLSTHSTNCFDGASSQASSSGTSGAGASGASSSSGGAGRAKAKLQLIDESSMISGTIDETLEDATHLQLQQQQLVEAATVEISPARHLIYSGYRQPNHVDVVDYRQQQQQQHGVDSSVLGPHTSQLIGATTNFGNLFTSNGEQHQVQTARLYGSPSQRLLSTSFASAADLLQRQQQHQVYYQQHQVQLQPDSGQEPIYQRLDKFQSYGMPLCKQQQFATMSQQQAKSLRFNDGNHFSMDDASKTMTLHRQFQQQHTQLMQQPSQTTQQQQLDEPQQYLCGFDPPVSLQQQQQQSQTQVRQMDYPTSYEHQANNNSENIDQQQDIICNNQHQQQQNF